LLRVSCGHATWPLGPFGVAVSSLVDSHMTSAGDRRQNSQRMISRPCEQDTVKTATIEIVDHGRGPQLSTRRITVQDLLPHFRDGASNEEIRRWIPALGDDEIALLKDFIRDHYEKVLRTEQEIKAYHDRMRAAQPPWTRATDHLSIEERRALLREQLAQRQAEKLGADEYSWMKTSMGTPSTCRGSFFHLHGAISVPCSTCALPHSRRSALPSARRTSRFGSSASTRNATSSLTTQPGHA
jgi:hypothetical protein